MVHNNCHRSPQEHKVQPQVPVVNIPTIHLHSLRIGNITPSACLPHTCNPGKNRIIFFNIFPISGNLRLHDRPGSYEAHFAFQDIPELGEFVEAGLTEEGAALCDAGVVFQFEFLIPFRLCRGVRSQEVFQHFLGVHAHGPELVAVELFPVLPHSPVFEDHRARGVVIDPDGNGQKDGRYEDAAADGGHDIKDPFQQLVPGAGQVIPDMKDHDFRIEEGFCGDIGHGDSHQIRNHVYLFHQGLGAVDEV